jgi:nucleotide-binding universal stress UspA family protein
MSRRKLMYKKILLPIDGSENSKRAAVHAINIASDNDGHITVLFVVEPPNPGLEALPIATLPTPDENYYIELREEGKKIIQEFMNMLEEKKYKNNYKNVHITSLIGEGKAFIEILEAIDEENIDLVIMGASGRHSTLDRLTLGSVTESVIRGSPVPVLVIP